MPKSLRGVFCAPARRSGMRQSCFKKGKIFVISAPSGTGKTTIESRLKNEIPNLDVVISYTTRKPRPQEKNEIDYCFITKNKFESMIAKSAFVEWAVVYGNYYGTSKDFIEKKLMKGKKILLTLDTQGGCSIKKIYPQAVLIGILPPSLKEQEKRIRKRIGISEEEVQKRLGAAKEERKVLFGKYDYRLVNRYLENTIEKIKKIVLKQA